MKYKLVYLSLIVLILSSCKKAEDLHFDPTFSGLNIWLGANPQKADSIVYNYAYKSINETDTVNFTVRLIGLPASTDREFQLKAIGGDTLRIKKDVHYTLPKYTLKAGAYTGVFPLYIKKSSDFINKPGKIIFGLKEDNNFKKGSATFADLTVILKEEFSKPSNWDVDPLPYFKLSQFFGTYSYVKFQFITTALGQPFVWKVKYQGTAAVPPNEISYQQALYYQSRVKIALADYNAAHPTANLKSEFGDLITFP
jgi:hypothetical protein